MRDKILEALLGTAIGMGTAMILAFIPIGINEYLYPSGGMIVLAPSGFVAVIFSTIVMGIIGGFIGLIVGALGLRGYQGAVVGLLFVVLRWRAIYDSIQRLSRRVESGHVDLVSLFPELLILLLVLECVIVGAVVSLSLRRFFPR